MVTPTDLAATARELYAGPREAFVRARNELAKAARAAGHAELAGAIAALVKPSATAWAVDRVLLLGPERIDALFEAAAELRAAIASGGGPHAIATPKARHREALAAATAVAVAELGDVSPANRRRIHMTLEALGALGRWPAPGPGCLAEDLDPPGFEATGGMPLLAAPEVVHDTVSANDAALVAERARARDRLREAARHADVCLVAHDELEAALRERVTTREAAASALARARIEHDAAVAAEAAVARDLEQRTTELAAAKTALFAAQAALNELAGLGDDA